MLVTSGIDRTGYEGRLLKLPMMGLYTKLEAERAVLSPEFGVILISKTPNVIHG